MEAMVIYPKVTVFGTVRRVICSVDRGFVKETLCASVSLYVIYGKKAYSIVYPCGAKSEFRSGQIVLQSFTRDCVNRPDTLPIAASGLQYGSPVTTTR